MQTKTTNKNNALKQTASALVISSLIFVLCVPFVNATSHDHHATRQLGANANTTALLEERTTVAGRKQEVQLDSSQAAVERARHVGLHAAGGAIARRGDVVSVVFARGAHQHARWRIRYVMQRHETPFCVASERVQISRSFCNVTITASLD